MPTHVYIICLRKTWDEHRITQRLKSDLTCTRSHQVPFDTLLLRRLSDQRLQKNPPSHHDSESHQIDPFVRPFDHPTATCWITSSFRPNTSSTAPSHTARGIPENATDGNTTLRFGNASSWLTNLTSIGNNRRLISGSYSKPRFFKTVRTTSVKDRLHGRPYKSSRLPLKYPCKQLRLFHSLRKLGNQILLPLSLRRLSSKSETRRLASSTRRRMKGPVYRHCSL